MIYGWTGYSGELPKRMRGSQAPVPPSTVTLTHLPTGVSVSGEVPRRRLSRRAMQDEVMKVRKKLFAELEKAVGAARKAARKAGAKAGAR